MTRDFLRALAIVLAILFLYAAVESWDRPDDQDHCYESSKADEE